MTNELPPILNLLDPGLVSNPPQEVDWQKLLDAAIFHGVFPLVNRQCSLDGGTNVPKEFLWKLAAYEMQNQERCRQLRVEWLEILELFHRRNIPVIPIKGFWLAEAVYGDSSIRNFTDLDYFVKEADLDQCKELLRSTGYVLEYPSSDDYERKLRPRHYELGFSRKDTLVELQYRFASGFLSLNINSDEIWKRAKPIQIDNIPAFQMSTEDALLYLCIHSWKHGWSRAKWICDLAQLLNAAGKENQAISEIDWDVVAQRAQESHVERIVLDSLLLTQRLLHVSFPQDLTDRLGGVRSSALHAGAGVPGDFPSKWAEARHWLIYRPRLLDRLKMALSFLYPTETDFQSVPLPKALFFLYYPLRPFLILKKLFLLLIHRNSAKTNLFGVKKQEHFKLI